MQTMNDENNKSAPILDQSTLALLSTYLKPLDEVDPDCTTMQALRNRVMQQIDTDLPDTRPSRPLTIRADDGDWQTISPFIQKKMLHQDNRLGTQTYLLRVQPGAEDEPHIHLSDEHCLVLEGEISFGDLHLGAGDYHLAPRGSRHERATTRQGALLFIQTGLEQAGNL